MILFFFPPLVKRSFTDKLSSGKGKVKGKQVVFRGHIPPSQDSPGLDNNQLLGCIVLFCVLQLCALDHMLPAETFC